MEDDIIPMDASEFTPSEADAQEASMLPPPFETPSSKDAFQHILDDKKNTLSKRIGATKYQLWMPKSPLWC